MTEDDILRKAVSILERRAKYNTKKDTLSDPDSVTRILRLHYAAINDGSEKFTVLYLDTRHRLIELATPFHGTVDSAAVYPREIVKRALQLNCSACIFSHNHPSGVVTPSDTDVRLTNTLKEALKLVDVRVLDHIIIGDNTDQVHSMARQGLL